MIESFSAKNFKCFKEIEVPALSRITLIGGRNNSGKTSLLEAMFMFLSRWSPLAFMSYFQARQYTQVGLPLSLWDTLFFNFDPSNEIVLNLSVNEQEEILKMSVSADGTIEISAQEIVKLITLKLEYRAKNQNTPKEVLYHLSSKVDFESSEKSVEEVYPMAGFVGAQPFSAKSLSDQYSNLDIQYRSFKVLDFLQLLDGRIKGLTVNNSMLFCDVGLSRKIPLSLVGEGMFKIGSIAAVLLSLEKGGVLFIDEIENGIHYSVMPKVWKAIAETARANDYQVIATTHSYECLQHAIEGTEGEFASDLSYIRLDRQGEKIEAKVFDSETLAFAIEKYMEVR